MASMTITFESDDFSEFDTAPVGTSLDINEDAGHIGTYGLEIDMAGTFTTTGVETTALSGSFTQLRTGAWINIDNLTLSTSKLTQFLTFLHDSSDMGSIRLRENGSGTIQILVTVQDDSGSDGQIISIPSGWFHVEVIVTQASTAVSNDGVYEIKINGTQEYIDSTVDNYNYIDDMGSDDYEFRLYPIAAESGVSGDLYVDHIQWNDDGTTLYNPPVSGTPVFDLKVSQMGLRGHAMAVTPDGENIAFALETDPDGDQVISSQTRPTDLGVSTTQRLYTPGGGTAGNVAATPDIDRIIAFGNFGTNKGVYSIVISTATETDISPSTIGADVIQPAAVDPSDVDHIVAINNDDQDAIETSNGGTSWTTLNAALGQDVTSLDVVFFGQYLPFSAFFGGDDGSDKNLAYTPNAFANFREDTSVSLKAVNDISGIAIVVDYGN